MSGKPGRGASDGVLVRTPTPRYRPRAAYRTRRSAAERVALDPTRDFGATALDRPRVDLPTLRLRACRVRPPGHWLERPGTLRRLVAAVLLGCAALGGAIGAVLAVLR
ncbi:MAG: hypothetical protein R3B82_15905 [Sandaracinaceae bacterium]